ncbi:MAG: ATP-binding protein [Reichenbachiella sp.]|uniref:AAA family ATPase n=1 Tax=Reichenbachiella sp. TaxID=2184521 RepID=UPI00326782A7
MIIKLSVANFLSFNDKIELSLESSPIKELVGTNTFEPPIKGASLLKSVGLFGANSSGKSNVIKTLSFMKSFVMNSFIQIHATEKINVDCFKLNTGSLSKPSFFEIEFIVNDTKYRYGFEVDKYMVRKEWLFYTLKRQEKRYFERTADEFEIDNSFREAWNIKHESIRQNALFLSALAQYNGTISRPLYQWFEELTIITDTNYGGYINYTASLLNNLKFKSYLKKLLHAGDFGYFDVEINETEIDPNQYGFLSEDIRNLVVSKIPKHVDIKTKHKSFDQHGGESNDVLMDFKKEESQGTQKFFALAGPIILSLMEGRPLIIDEIDARLHPLLSRMIIHLFNSDDNQHGSQLVFTTHNTSILNIDILRRDQMLFVSKTLSFSSKIESIYSLKVRNDASFEKDYLSGKYGALPGENQRQLKLFS